MKRLDIRLIRMIKDSLGQFIAVTLVILIGILVYTSLSIAMINFENSVYDYFDKTNFFDMNAQIIKIPEKNITKINNLQGITNTEGRIVLDGALIDEGKRVNVRSISYNKNNTINTLYFIDGEGIKDSGKDVLLLDSFAEARNIKVGDIVSIQFFGKEYKLYVRGLVASAEFIYLMENEQNILPNPKEFGIIYVSDELSRLVSGLGSNYNELVLKLEENANREIVKDKLKDYLDKYGVKRIIPRDEQLSTSVVIEEIKGNKKMTSTIPILFLFVAGVIIAVTLSRKVKNDRISIGIIKAIGYKESEILSHYVKYSLVIGILGALAGSILGTILSRYFTIMYISYYKIPEVNLDISLKPIIISLIITCIFCIIFGILGCKNVLKINPAEAMKPEVSKKMNVKFLAVLTPIIIKLTFTYKMVVRNIFRGYRKVIFVSMGIGLTFSIILVVVSLFINIFSMFDAQFGEFQDMDYEINFNRPLDKSVINTIEHMAEIDYIEPKIEYPYEIIFGNKSKVVNIIGLEKNTKIFNFKNIYDDKIDIPEKGIIVTENLKKLLDVEKGDRVFIDTFIPDKDGKYFVIKDVVKQGLGINGYINIENMDKDMLEKGVITGIYINSKDNIKDIFKDVESIGSIKSIQELKEMYKEFLSMSIATIAVMVIFGCILGYAIVYNSNVMIIDERRLEFSSLRVMGFTNDEIIRIVNREVLIMSIIGILMGSWIGRFMLKGVAVSFSNELYTMESNISVEAYGITLIATVLFVLTANMISNRKIKRIDFIEALKSRIV